MQCRQPPQAQIRLSGSMISSTRGRWLGREPRLVARGLVTLFPAGASASSSAWIAAMAVSRSSSARSNWSGSVFSDLRPKAACLKAATSFSSRSIRSSLRQSASCRLACLRRDQHRLQGGNIVGKIGGVQHGRNLPNPARFAFGICRPESSCRSYSMVSGALVSTARTRRQSRPANSASNWAWLSVIRPSLMPGQVKVCSSNRL